MRQLATDVGVPVLFLSNLCVVMAETTHPGNIGAAARAMKNMGVTDLRLVNPRVFPSSEAVARASGADDLLAAARVCSSLDQAIADCSIVVGASARDRTVVWPELTPRACAESLGPLLVSSRIAVLFGREHSGLTNEELDRCQYLLRIPCNPEFSSLNVAAAVQVTCYEFLVQAQAAGAADRPPADLADASEMESFFGHLRQSLFDIGFFHATKSSPSLMRRLRRLFHRAHLERTEIHMLRGILSQMQIRLGRSPAAKDSF